MNHEAFLVDQRRRKRPMLAFPLASPANFHWSIELLPPNTQLKRIEPLAREVVTLIRMAWDFYPPAIALARDDLRHGLRDRGGEDEKVALVKTYGECLHFYLESQRHLGHFLAKGHWPSG